MLSSRFALQFVRGIAALAILAGVGLPAAAGDAAGFLYGKVTTDSGEVYEGRIRWDDEEASWADMFNATKEERPYIDEVPRADRQQAEAVKIFGLTVGRRYPDASDSRSMAVRFGDIAEIRPEGSSGAVLVLRNGTEFDLHGGSNDLGADIVVWDAAGEEEQLDWYEIERIEFAAAPNELEVGVQCIHGTLVTDNGTFRGNVQWDKDERLSTDELDGEDDDGEEYALKFGEIRSIARYSHSRSLVTLRDGRELVLGGTNDVNDQNRGIYVDDPRIGRVLVEWDAFERVDFSEPGETGPGYADFAPGSPLRGTVTDVDGATHSGRIVYDLDESESWELLDGNAQDVAFSIPMGLVATIVPKEDGSVVTLKSGEELWLRDTADVGRGNDGIAVVQGEDEFVYVAWDRIRRVDLE